MNNDEKNFENSRSGFNTQLLVSFLLFSLLLHFFPMSSSSPLLFTCLCPSKMTLLRFFFQFPFGLVRKKDLQNISPNIALRNGKVCLVTAAAASSEEMKAGGQRFVPAIEEHFSIASLSLVRIEGSRPIFKRLMLYFGLNKQIKCWSKVAVLYHKGNIFFTNFCQSFR